MRKIAVSLAIISILFCLFPAVCASESLERTIEQYEGSIDELYDELPYSAKKYLDESPSITGSISESLSTIINNLKDDFAELIQSALKAFVLLVSIISLCAAFNSLLPSSDSATVLAVDIVTSVLIVSSLFTTTLNYTDGVFRQIDSLHHCVQAFIPVFAGVVAACGHVTSSSLFSAASLALSQVVSQLIMNIIKPLCCVLLGFSAASGCANEGLSKSAQGLSKTINWLLGIAATVFLGYIKLQCSVSASADKLTLKTGKFIVGSSVPVIGTTISDALSNIAQSMAIAKSGVGTAGIAMLTAIVLPSLAGSLLFCLALRLSALYAEILSQTCAARTIRLICCCVETVTAVLSVYFVVLVFSVSSIVSGTM